MSGILGAGEWWDLRVTGVADGAAITGKQFVKYSGEPNLYVQCDTLGEHVDGVALWDCADGDCFTLNQEGPTEVISGAAVAAAALVTTDAAGKCITAVSGNYVVGKAETAAAGADEFMIVNVRHGGHILP